MTNQPTSTARSTLPGLLVTQPRTTLLPPAPGRHHWCFVVPASTLPQFDADRADARLHAVLVERLWERGVGCARFDLFEPSSGVVASHPAAFDRQVQRADDVLERLHRIDERAEVTVLASGDAVDVAFALEDQAAGRPWPVLRSLLLVPGAAMQTARLDRQAIDLARAVAHDERPPARSARAGVTRQVLRRLGW